MSDLKQQVTGLTAEQLKDLMVSMAAELRKPADPTPEELAQAENDKNSRAETAKLQLAKLEKQHNDQIACTHRRNDGTSSCVFEYMGGFLICQQCQAIIKPGTCPAGAAGKEVSHHFFDTRMFNGHFRESQAGKTTF